MNWKRIVLVAVLGFFALAFFTVAAVGFAATAALGTAAVAISESGVVEAFEEVAADVERLQIEAGEDYVTFTDLDSGESRTINSGDRFGQGRVEFSLPELTITAQEGDQDGGQSGQITISGPDGEQARITVTESQRPDVDVDIRAPRFDSDSDFDWSYDGDDWYGPERGLMFVGELFRGLCTLTVMGLIAAAAVVLVLRNRNGSQAKVVQVEDEDPIKGDDNS